MMNPVHAIGVFHDQNGSMWSSVAVSETTMIAKPIHGRNLSTIELSTTEDTEEESRTFFPACPSWPPW